MQTYDLHMHTTYCDGKSSAEEMVLSAIEKGLSVVGISGHSFTPHDPSYCMSREGTLQYIREITALKEKYADRITVLLGIERDYYADTDMTPYDYWLGSVHYLFTDQARIKYDNILESNLSADRAVSDAASLAELKKYSDWNDVDSEPYDLRRFALIHDMDMMSVAELYYETAGAIVSRTDCDIIGHFDLLTKFNERYRLMPDETVVDLWGKGAGRSDSDDASQGGFFFDTSDKRYIDAWKRAIDRIFEECAARYKGGYRNRLEVLGILEAGEKPVFEINTGAISRGYRRTPYPAEDQISYIKSNGGLLILSSDSHSADAVRGGFEEFKDLIR